MSEHFTDILPVLIFVFLAREFVTFKQMTPARYMLTPLITLIICGIAILAIYENGMTTYRFFVLTGLIISAIADTILMIKEVDLLKYGIVYFLAAHIMYVVAFTQGYTFAGWNIIVAAVLIASVGFIYKQIQGKTGGLDIPILVYAVVISAMVFFAYAAMNDGFSRQGMFTLAGATLFILSDGLLAYNAFVKPVPHDSVLTWALYAPAQLFIAASCFG